jgi:hypothetical protein
MQKITLLVISIFFLYTGCVKDKIESPIEDGTKEYFPLKPGQFVIYSIDSIVIDDAPGGNVKDTVSFQIREEITNFQISLSGDTLFYVERSRRNHVGDPWQLTDLWTASRSTSEALRTEENLKFRKMIFPLYKGRRWLSTAYIPASTTILVGTENIQAFQDWTAEVLSIDKPDQVGSFNFVQGQVMQVSQTDTDDGSTKRFVLEKYARNIGLVQRIDTILDSRCIELGDFTECIGKPWLVHAGKGYILSQVMIEHN